MLTKMNINKYLALGGLLKNLDLSKTTVTYHDENNGKKIAAITYSMSSSDKTLFYVTFENGRQHSYGGMWIDTHVELVLDTRYTESE